MIYTINNVPPKELYDDEFNFGDRRLDKRAAKMIKSMTHNMGKAIPEIYTTKAELYGAYRFYDNDLVIPEKILASHAKATIQRIKNEDVVLAIQDSTDLTYDYLKTLEGLFPLHLYVEKGMRLHPSLVVTEQGTPLGIVNSMHYTRVQNPEKKHRNYLSIEEKESFRWLAGYRAACEISVNCSNTTIVSIADQECDIYECLAEAQDVDLGQKAHILIRAQHNRYLEDESDDGTNQLLKKLIRCPIAYEAKLKVRQEKKQTRELNIAIRATTVRLKAPSTYKKKSLPSININAILVSEIEPSQEPIEWLILTTLPINTQEAIEKIISYYATRWQIEVFFKILKSGCKIDSIRLQTVSRIENYIALSLIVAWKTMLATYLPREYPNACCTVLFTEIEWKLAYKAFYKEKRPLPNEPPTLKEATELIAALGGYLKKRDPPGIQTIWRGIIRLMNMMEGYDIAKKMPNTLTLG